MTTPTRSICVTLFRFSSTGLLGVLLATAGCGDGDTRVIPIERTGLLTVNWSINGTLDPGLCEFYVVDAMEVVIFDAFGNFVTEVEAPCESFSLTVELEDGLYDGEATLVGFADEAATITEVLENLDIVEDTDLVVEVDYPAGSFL